MSHTIRKYPANPSFAISASSCFTCARAFWSKCRFAGDPYRLRTPSSTRLARKLSIVSPSGIG